MGITAILQMLQSLRVTQQIMRSLGIFLGSQCTFHSTQLLAVASVFDAGPAHITTQPVVVVKGGLKVTRAYTVIALTSQPLSQSVICCAVAANSPLPAMAEVLRHILRADIAIGLSGTAGPVTPV